MAAVVVILWMWMEIWIEQHYTPEPILLLLCLSVRESLVGGSLAQASHAADFNRSLVSALVLLPLKAYSRLSRFCGSSELTMPDVEGEPTSLLDLIASLLPDSVEDITYLTDMDGEGLCLHQMQAEEQRTTPEEEK